MTDVLANRSADDRSAVDLYETPEEVTDAIVEWLDMPRSTVLWEPAAGPGRMVRRLQYHGYQVLSSDIVTGEDFLRAQVRGDFIITNPPFSIASDFIKRALDTALPFALLLKSQFWHAQERLPVWGRRAPRAVLPLTWRPDFLFGEKGGAPTMECLWTVWPEKNGTHQAIYHPLSRPTMSGGLV